MNKEVKKIRKEIERLHGNPYYMMAIRNVLSIIDSLQEEPVSEELEEVAREAATWHSRNGGERFFPNDYQKFIAGANWKEKQMMKDAVDAKFGVIEDCIIRFSPFELRKMKSQYKDGDKVKLIIIKE